MVDVKVYEMTADDFKGGELWSVANIDNLKPNESTDAAIARMLRAIADGFHAK